MLNLIWREEASRQFEEILAYVAFRHEEAAYRIENLVQLSAERLSSFPYMHRPGRVAGTREAVVHPNYILIYRVTADSVEILNVVHARQEYP